jgi:O-antigen biosynthesis protein
VRRDMQPYCRVDSLTSAIPERYDLITCIEVLEHIPSAQAEIAVENLCQAADTILFSSTPSDLVEATHCNVRPTIYWLQLFSRFDFWPCVLIDAGFVAPHAMFLRKGARPAERDVLVLFSELLRYKAAHAGQVTQRERESAAALEQLRLRENEIRTIAERVTELREESVLLKHQNTTLLRQRNQLQQDLHEMAQSAAWKLIERYRTWLWRQQVARPRLFRTYERIAVRLLRAGNPERTGEAQTAAPAEPAPTEEEAESPAPFSIARESEYQRWIDENEPGRGELRKQREVSLVWNDRPLFSIALPVYRVSAHALTECIQSVVDQSYERWELCIAFGYPEDEANRQLVMDFAAGDRRIQVKLLEKNLGISGNTNAAVDMATGEYVVFVDHDDALAPSALYEAAALLNRKPHTAVIYSDHDYIQENDSVRFHPLFKPDWSPEIMFSANYITHLTVIRRLLVQEAGGFDAATDGAQDWDLFFRVVEKAPHIEHIPKVLYHWRVHPGSTALNSQAKSYADDAQLVAISRHMERMGLPATPERTAAGLLHVSWKPGAERLVSIVIPTRDKVDLLSKCVSSILDKTDYPSYEILIIDTGSREQATRDYYAKLDCLKKQVRVLEYPAAVFNYSAVNNFGARQARGDLLLFLNNDTEITRPEWMRELAGWAAYAPVGIVGGKLLRPNGAIQHAGVVVGLGGFADHPFGDLPPLTDGMYGSTGWYRNYLAVTGACMMMRREVFDALGGFDESFTLCGSDVEIGLRAWDHGYRVVYNPFAELIHHERQTRKTEIPLEDFVVSYKHYRKYLESGDPYWNQSLSLWNTKIGFRFKEEQSSLEFVQSYLETLNPSSAGTGPAKKPAKLLTPKRPPTEEQLMVGWFDFSEEEVRLLKQQAATVTGRRNVETIVWLIPPFVNAFYGGIFTILRFAEHWRRARGVHNIFAVCGSADPAVMLGRIKKVLPECRKSDLYVLSDIKDVKDLPAADAAISTLWLTAYFALRYRKVPRRFYFIQDYEPAFFRAGSTSGLVESTYRLGFYGITNTASLRKFYEDEYGGKAVHFTPCVDQKLFHPLDRKRSAPSRRPWQVCCYARPSHGRNAFELLSAALRQLKSRLGEKVRIVAAGEDWNAADHDLQGVVENLGVLPYRDTARLYRESDVGVVLMLTRHPSYIPMELMASGCLVVTNRNHWTEWLLEHERTCLLTYTAATCLADTIERGLTNEALREEITRCALQLVRERYYDWTPEMEKVYEFMCDPDLEQPGQ